LLLGRLGGLRLLLLLGLTALFHAANQSPGGGPDGRPRPRIASDRAADGAHSRPTGRSPENTPLGRRRRRRAGLGSGGIKAGLLNSPEMTVIAIATLLLRIVWVLQTLTSSATKTRMLGFLCCATTGPAEQSITTTIITRTAILCGYDGRFLLSGITGCTSRT
jgi:hypothetical protein